MKPNAGEGKEGAKEQRGKQRRQRSKSAARRSIFRSSLSFVAMPGEYCSSE